MDAQDRCCLTDGGSDAAAPGATTVPASTEVPEEVPARALPRLMERERPLLRLRLERRPFERPCSGGAEVSRELETLPEGSEAEGPLEAKEKLTVAFPEAALCLFFIKIAGLARLGSGGAEATSMAD